MGRNFAYKEPLEAGVVAPLGPLGGKANTQLFAGDRENQWVSSAKAAMGRFPHWVILLSLKWCIKDGGGENKLSLEAMGQGMCHLSQCSRESHRSRKWALWRECAQKWL